MSARCSVRRWLTIGWLGLAWTLLAGQVAVAQEADQGDPSDYGVEGYSRNPDDPDFTPYSPFYTGAFLAVGGFAGPTFLGGDRLDMGSSWAAGGWIQASSPLQVIDVRLSYYGSSHERELDGGRPVSIRQDVLLLSAGGHPFFLAHLENSRFFYTLGSLYLLGGVDVEFVRAEVGGTELSEVDFGIQLGAGFDVAIDDMDDGGALWLGVQYLYNQWDFDEDPLRDLSVGQHLLLIELSYRKNGLIVPI